MDRQTRLPLDASSHDPVTVLANHIADMALRECAFLDELWLKRHPTTYSALSKLQHQRFMTELTAFYCCACEDYLEWNFPANVDRFMEMLAAAIAHAATRDNFIANPPYSQFDVAGFRQWRYAARIGQSRSKLKFIPLHLRIDWMAARTALELRRILGDRNDDPNELSVIECRLAERLEWTAAELTG